MVGTSIEELSCTENDRHVLGDVTQGRSCLASVSLLEPVQLLLAWPMALGGEARTVA